MKRLLYGLLPLLVFSLVACATSSDLRAVRTELNQQLEAKLAATDARVADLQKEQEKNAATLSAMRKGQANTTADFAELRDQIQQLRGQVESLKKEIEATRAEKKKLEEPSR